MFSNDLSSNYHSILIASRLLHFENGTFYWPNQNYIGNDESILQAYWILAIEYYIIFYS